MPEAQFPVTSVQVGSLASLADRFDVFLLDAFGVLNVGKTAIPSALERVATLQASGKKLLVLSNSATLPKAQTCAKLNRLGYNFSPQNMVTSREALATALPHKRWGAMAAVGANFDDLPAQIIRLGNTQSEFDTVEGFLLLSTKNWTEEQQEMLQTSLTQNPRPVWVANPDIVAPREGGLSLQPAYYAHLLKAPLFFGKPFGNIFEHAFQRLGALDKSRVLMLGDTLHTDILGAAAFGLKTALVTGHGVYKGCDYHRFIKTSGIRPNYILPSL